eukprot:TRINITY_DN4726_c0_g1_i1.p2 TRINITY_DN4726_c0_g1~~TRINITY_DN4726_c0_g1_i1.p2  ORF type:complete len:231 (+),score=83.09 TRINITY_DN4726_c0_g1_i1:202-894(+)
MESVGGEQVGLFAGVFAALTVLYIAIGYILDPARGKYGRSAESNEPSTVVVAAAVAIALYALPITTTEAYNQTVCADGLCNPSALKPYSSFAEFYNTRYVQEHQVPEDRAMHVIIFVSTMAVMCSRPGLLVTWCAMMAAGALLTRPLLSLSLPYVEVAVMFVVAAVVSSRYDQHAAFYVVASAWMMADLASHVWVGENGAAALYIGEHYLSWGLWGQAKLVLGIIMDGGI